MKTSVFILLITCPNILSAGLLLDDSNPTETQRDKQISDAEVYSSQGQNAQGGIFNPQNVKNSKNIWIDGEALLWQASEDGLNYAVKSTSQNSVNNGRVKSPDFEWNWGFRLGLGFKLPHDQWDLFFNYTYMQAHARASASAPTDGALFPLLQAPFGLPSNFFANSAKFHWRANLNIGDVELGRNCLVGRALSIRPFMSIRGLFIDQVVKINYRGGTAVPVDDVDQAYLMNDFWGIGLRMGADTLWALGAGWGIYGNGAASLISGSFDMHEKEKLKVADEPRLNLKVDTDSVVAIAELALGIQWDKLFSKDRYHFGVKFGWEFNVFFDQNRLVRFVSSNPASISQNDDDLSFQGLTFGLRFDF